MKRTDRRHDGREGGLSTMAARKGLRPVAGVLCAAAGHEGHGGGVTLEKLRERVAQQEKWTSGYRQIIDTIIRIVPRDRTGGPDLAGMPAHTRDVLVKTEQSLAREGAILERLREELRRAERLCFSRGISGHAAGNGSSPQAA